MKRISKARRAHLLKAVKDIPHENARVQQWWQENQHRYQPVVLFLKSDSAPEAMQRLK